MEMPDGNRNSRAVVANFNQDISPAIVGAFKPVGGVNENVAAARHGLDRIFQQVGKHLHQISPVSRKRRELGVGCKLQGYP